MIPRNISRLRRYCGQIDGYQQARNRRKLSKPFDIDLTGEKLINNQLEFELHSNEHQEHSL